MILAISIKITEPFKSFEVIRKISLKNPILRRLAMRILGCARLFDAADLTRDQIRFKKIDLSSNADLSRMTNEFGN